MQNAFQRRIDTLYPGTSDLSVEQNDSFRIGRGGVLAAVIAVHLIALYIVMHMPSLITRVYNEPMQVVMLTEVHQEQVVPPPPATTSFPVASIEAIEPMVNVHIESAPVTVTAHAEETPVANVGVSMPREVSSVEYVRQPLAKYPSAARALKQRGIVTLRALIDVSGHATEVNIYRSSGYKLLDDAARNAALNALYKPYTENGRAVPVYVLIPIEFGS